MNLSPIDLAERVELWQHRLAPLGVTHWRIERIVIGDADALGEASENANASAIRSKSYDSVTFFFLSEYVEEATEKQLDETIVHEWLHVYGRDLDELHTRVETWMPEATYDDFKDNWHHLREGEVERMARLIVALYNAPRKADIPRLNRLFRTTLA